MYKYKIVRKSSSINVCWMYKFDDVRLGEKFDG